MATADVEVVVDYAHPTMMAEDALHDMHLCMLDRDYEKALEHAMRALAETKLAINAIRHQQEKSK